MNRNIEVINPYLWAVKFSWLPWISDLKVNLDPAYSSDEQVCAISSDGVLILNIDNPLFSLYRKNFPMFQKKNSKILKRELISLERMGKKSDLEEMYLAMLQLELERRRIATSA